MFTIQQTHFNYILHHAHTATPAECCGLIGGRDVPAQRVDWPRLGLANPSNQPLNRRVIQSEIVIAIPNISPTPKTNFEMDHRKMVEGILQIQARGLDLVGIYHSHPVDPPVMSSSDLRGATWAEAVYLIVGHVGSPQEQVQAWQVRRGMAT